MFFFSAKPSAEAAVPDVEAGGRGGGALERFSGATANAFQRITDRTDALVESTQNYQTGMLIIGAGFLFIALSLLFLPLFLLKPYKFCALYSMGTMSIFVGIAVMRGRSLAKSLRGKRNALITFLFLGSFALEFYYAVIDCRYFLVIAFLVVHTICTLYLLSTAVPGGTRALNAFFGFFLSGVRSSIGSPRASLPI